MSDDDGKIIRPNFAADRQGDGRTTIRQTHKFRIRCKHFKLEVDDRLRTVECIDCGANVDPFEVIVGYAERERLFSHTQAQVDSARKRMKELKHEEQLIKARIRNAKNKASKQGILL